MKEFVTASTERSLRQSFAEFQSQGDELKVPHSRFFAVYGNIVSGIMPAKISSRLGGLTIVAYTVSDEFMSGVGVDLNPDSPPYLVTYAWDDELLPLDFSGDLDNRYLYEDEAVALISDLIFPATHL